MYSFTSGRRRHVSARKGLMSGRTVSSSPSRRETHRRVGARRMGPLRNLGELVRVAEEHVDLGGGSDRERIGERDLPALVDEQDVDGVVELLVRKQPRCAGEELELGIEQVV